MRQFEILDFLTSIEDTQLYNWLVSKNVLKEVVNCRHCGILMKLKKKDKSYLQKTWRCMNFNCIHYESTSSILKDSFLSEVKIEPRDFLKSIFYILNNTELVDIKRFLSISYKSLKNIKKLITNKIKEFFGCNPIRLGGDGIIVHVDETMLLHAVKSHRGRVARNQSWALTIVDTSEKPGLRYCQIVDKRDSSTLIPIISRIVRPGSIIHTDEWKAYINLNQRILTIGQLEINIILLILSHEYTLQTLKVLTTN